MSGAINTREIELPGRAWGIRESHLGHCENPSVITAELRKTSVADRRPANS